MHSSTARVLVVGLLCLAGCAGTTPRRGTDLTASRDGADELVQGPHVPTGTRFVVRLLAPLDLSGVAQGQAFEGYLSDTLRTASGAPFIEAGARVRGTIAVGGRTGRLSLHTATVESPVGPLALRGSLHTGLAGETDALADGSASDGLHHAAARTTGGPERAASTPEALAAAPTTGNGFVLARDAEVEVTLTRPLLAPGASVIGAR